MRKKQLPLVLRLLHFKDARNADVHLVTNVLKEKSLNHRQAGEIYRRRWGIEIQFRSLKQKGIAKPTTPTHFWPSTPKIFLNILQLKLGHPI